eukprot:EG_transcript_14662
MWLFFRGRTPCGARFLTTSRASTSPPSAGVTPGRCGKTKLLHRVPSPAVQAHLAVYGVNMSKVLRCYPSVASYDVERVEQMTSYLAGLGVDVKRVLDRNADILGGKVDKYEQKVQMLRDSGINVVRVINMNPGALKRRIAALQGIMDAISRSGHSVAAVVDRNPNVLRCAVSSLSSILQPRRNTSLAQPPASPLDNDPRVALLSSMGLDTNQLLRRGPKILFLSFEKMRSVVDYLTGLRVDVRKVVQRNPNVLGMRPDALQQRVQFLSEHGLDVVHSINTYPGILHTSVEGKLRPILTFIFHEIGLPLSELRNAGPIWGCSLEGRLRPRFLYLKSLGRPVGCLSNFVVHSDRRFTETIAKTDLAHYYAWRLQNGLAVPPRTADVRQGATGR